MAKNGEGWGVWVSEARKKKKKSPSESKLVNKTINQSRSKSAKTSILPKGAPSLENFQHFARKKISMNFAWSDSRIDSNNEICPKEMSFQHTKKTVI